MYIYLWIFIDWSDVVLVGIMFQDITTLLLDPVAFKDTIDLFVERYKHMNISVVAGKFCLICLLLFRLRVPERM